MSVDAASIKRPVRLEHVHECLGVLTEYARSQGFANPDIHNIRLIAEEVLANIISHAYGNYRGDVKISCRPGPGHGSGRLIIEFRDSGVPFTSEPPEPDRSAVWAFI